jgi:hypothetical protein
MSHTESVATTRRRHTRDRVARAVLRLAKRKGSQVVFTNPGSAGVTVWAFVHKYTQSTGIRGGETDERTITFQIPRQTNFPPTAFKPGCTIKHDNVDGVVYGIDRIKPDNEDPEEAGTFMCECGRYGEDGQTVEID